MRSQIFDNPLEGLSLYLPLLGAVQTTTLVVVMIQLSAYIQQ